MILCIAHRFLFEMLQKAWERQLPQLSIPVRTTEGNATEGWGDVKLYMRNASGEWEEETCEYRRRLVLGPVDELQRFAVEDRVKKDCGADTRAFRPIPVC